MAEAYLSSTYYYRLLSKVLDVQTILTELETILPAAGWTHDGSDHFTSPADEWNRFFHLEFTRVSATNLNLLVKDAAGGTVGERRMYINGTAWANVQIFYGQYHFILDSLSGTGAEYLMAGILDLTPSTQDAHSRYVYMSGMRTNTGTASNYTLNYASMIDNATATHDTRLIRPNDGSNTGYQTFGGQYLYFPYETGVDTNVLTMGFAGRRYQQVLVGSELADRQSLIRLPIETGVLASFRGIHGPGTLNSMRLVCRVA